MCGVCPGPFGEELSPPFVSNMSKAQRHAGVGGLLREAIRSQIGFVAARKAGGGFRREVQPRRQHWFLNEKSGFPFRTPAFCSVSRGRRRLGEKEYRAPSVTPGVALRPRTQAASKKPMDAYVDGCHATWISIGHPTRISRRSSSRRTSPLVNASGSRRHSKP